MGAGENKRVEEMARAVVDYLRQHPNAMDSFDGIARFWIPRQRVEAELETLELAVRELVNSGVIEVYEVDSERFFRLPQKATVCRSEN